MRARVLLVGFWMGASPLPAQEGAPRDAPSGPREELVEMMLSERESAEALGKAIAAARAAGISEQAILEARFLFHVDRSEDKEIAALLPEFLARKDKFKLSDSEIFGNADDWLAVTEYVQALAALEKGDKEGFKRHIIEAFWLSPRQGAAFAPHIDRIRLMDAMKAVRVDFEKPYKEMIAGGDTKLGEILGARKALLLHFWSPWSRECEATLEDFLITAEHLAGHGVAVVSVLPETSEKVIADANAMLRETGKKIPGTWIVDTGKNPVSARLRVQSVPVVVLVSPEGVVLYNGHPADGEFWKALAERDPSIERPEVEEGE
jgi:hypothetical protein